MRLFEKKDNNIIVHAYIPDASKVSEFKEKELKKIDADCQLFRAETNSWNKPMRDSSLSLELLTLVEIRTGISIGGLFHKLEKSHLSPEQAKYILESYIYGTYGDQLKLHQLYPSYLEMPSSKQQLLEKKDALTEDDKRIIRSLKYYLSSDIYSNCPETGTDYIDGIINLPESLFLYHMLEREQYQVASRCDLTEQLSLFNLSDQDSITFDILEVEALDEKLKTAGAITEKTNCEVLEDYVRYSEKVLSLIRKTSNKK